MGHAVDAGAAQTTVGRSDWLDTYMRYVSATEPPSIYHAWCGVWAIAACLQRKCWLKWTNHLIFYPNFFVVLVGSSGVGKNTAMGIARELVVEAGVHLAPKTCTHQGLREEMREFPGSYMENGREVTHHSLSIQVGEFTGLTGKRDSEKLVALNELYDCDDPYIERTVGRGRIAIPRPWLNIIGGATPDGLSEFLPSEASGNGFIARLVMVYAANRSHANSMAETDAGLKPTLSTGLKRIAAMQGGFSRTAEYQTTYDSWYNAQHKQAEHGDENYGTSPGYLHRKASYVQKLATICAAARMTMTIDEGDFHAALNILESTEESRRRLSSYFGASRYAATLAKLREWLRIKAHPPIGVPESIVFRAFAGSTDPGDLGKLLNELALGGFIQIVRSRRGARIIWAGDGTEGTMGS